MLESHGLVVDDERRSLASMLADDALYRDVLCRPASFPTPRFRNWLHVYSVDLEITDPDGRQLAEATFPGCGCVAHHDDWAPADTHRDRRDAAVCWSQSASIVPEPAFPNYLPRLTRAAYGSRGRGRGGGRGARCVRRATGRRGTATRHSR